jgi:hypothetical protein
MRKLHLAQINIGRMRGALEGPVMSGFVARLDEINALADGSPGFVWRLQTDAGNATRRSLGRPTGRPSSPARPSDLRSRVARRPRRADEQGGEPPNVDPPPPQALFIDFQRLS